MSTLLYLLLSLLISTCNITAAATRTTSRQTTSKWPSLTIDNRGIESTNTHRPPLPPPPPPPLLESLVFPLLLLPLPLPALPRSLDLLSLLPSPLLLLELVLLREEREGVGGGGVGGRSVRGGSEHGEFYNLTPWVSQLLSRRDIENVKHDSAGLPQRIGPSRRLCSPAAGLVQQHASLGVHKRFSRTRDTPTHLVLIHMPPTRRPLLPPSKIEISSSTQKP